MNPRDSDLQITSDGDHIIFNGFKNFNTGGVVSDLTVLEGVLEDTTDHIFAYAPTRQSGLQFAVYFRDSFNRKLMVSSIIGTTLVLD